MLHPEVDYLLVVAGVGPEAESLDEEEAGLTALESEPEPDTDGESDDPESDSLLTFFFDPVLKSVSYQPLPFSRKAEAETSFFNSGFKHLGQSTNGPSLIFCSFSTR